MRLTAYDAWPFFRESRDAKPCLRVSTHGCLGLRQKLYQYNTPCCFFSKTASSMSKICKSKLQTPISDYFKKCNHIERAYSARYSSAHSKTSQNVLYVSLLSGVAGRYEV